MQLGERLDICRCWRQWDEEDEANAPAWFKLPIPDAKTPGYKYDQKTKTFTKDNDPTQRYRFLKDDKGVIEGFIKLPNPKQGSNLLQYAQGFVRGLFN